jgi:hypothetical protein
MEVMDVLYIRLAYLGGQMGKPSPVSFTSLTIAQYTEISGGSIHCVDNVAMSLTCLTVDFTVQVCRCGTCSTYRDIRPSSSTTNKAAATFAIYLHEQFKSSSKSSNNVGKKQTFG